MADFPKKIHQSQTMIFQIKPFKDNDFGVAHWENLLHNLISLKSKHISFRIQGNRDGIKLYVELPRDFSNYFQNTFYATFPTSDLLLQEVEPCKGENKYLILDKEAQFKKKDTFSTEGRYMDPMKEIFSVFQNIDKESLLKIVATYTLKLEKSPLQSAVGVVAKVVKYLRNSGKTEQTNAKISEIEAKPDLFIKYYYCLESADPYLKDSVDNLLSSVFAPLISNGKFKIKSKSPWIPTHFDEVVNFFHLPTQENFTKGMDYTLYRKLPYPSNIPDPNKGNHQDLTILGDTDYRGDSIRFGIVEEDKFRHMYIVGKTGTGKSTFINNMIISDMKADKGICVLDPHGELVDDLLEHIPSHRINDVILFDVGDSEYPIGFNLLQAENEDEKNRIASGVVSTFQKLFDNSRGPRLEYILRNVVLSIIDYPNATLMHILRVLTDKDFREEVISNVKDEVLLKFRNNEFNKWQDRQREEAVGPITNKVGQFLSSRLVRNIFGQPRTKLNIRKAMDEGKIILVNLSKGIIGEDNANMIGSLLVTKIQIDAMGRADVASHLRRPFYLYIDEFQNFATKSFATILSEARKYKLSLIVANQYTSQLDDTIKDAIFGNVGTIISFTLGYDDAAIMTSQFKELVSTNDLISLPKFTAYTRLMIEGVSSDPFSMKTLPPPQIENAVEHIEKIRKQSRQRYAMEKIQLESLMNAWNKKTFSAQEKIAERARYEGLGLSRQEAENLQDLLVQEQEKLFDKKIAGLAPDALIVDTEQGNHKLIRYQQPEHLSQEASQKAKKGTTLKLDEQTTLQFFVDIWQHQHFVGDNEKPLAIWIGSREEVYQQLVMLYQSVGMDPQQTNFLKYVPNISLLEAQKPEKNQPPSSLPASHSTLKAGSPIAAPVSPGTFSVKDIKLGNSYEGYVKLLYNYGIFVTVKGVEGLLHKKQILVPEGVDWKKYYNIGDKIQVKAHEFKDIHGEQKVVWTQL